MPRRRRIDVRLMKYTVPTPRDGLHAPLAVVPVDRDRSTGCDAGDFDGVDLIGKIALIKWGDCSYAEQAAGAAVAGAVGALVYGATDRPLRGTLGGPRHASLPTGGLSRPDGTALAAAAARHRVTVGLALEESRDWRYGRNVIAETRTGDPRRTLMLGAHLDSVAEGPGINDNGSGAAGLLETARALAAAHVRPADRVRFAWWSAEEEGGWGSSTYVRHLSRTQRRQIGLYVNLDMIASPNYGECITDGQGPVPGVRPRPGAVDARKVTRGMRRFLATRGLPLHRLPADWHSDYAGFASADIPFVALDTGAEVLKSPTYAAEHRGKTYAPYDDCYHRACDNLDNVDQIALDDNVDLLADTVGRCARDLTAVTRTSRR